MPNPINSDHPPKRQIRLDGIDLPVVITLHPHSLEMAIQGHTTKLWASWNDIANILVVPSDCPSIYYKEPFKFLQHIATIQAKRKAKRATKRSSKGSV